MKQGSGLARRGFTLSEVLMVMAVMLILSAIAVPTGGRLMRNAKQMELNRKAEDIYMLVQRNLVTAKLAGKTLQSTNPAVCYPNQETKGDANFNYGDLNAVWPASCSGTYPGMLAITFDPVNHTVTRVYYSEEAGETASTLAANYTGTDGRIGAYGG